MNEFKSYLGEVAYLGPDFFQESPEVWLNCGNLGGYALGAMRRGAKYILFDAASPVYPKIVAIAAHYNAYVRPLEETSTRS